MKRRSEPDRLFDVKLRATTRQRDQARRYERQLTDLQFASVRALAEDHKLFHDREHLLYESAVDRAAADLKTQLEAMASNIERMREESHGFLSTDRFEREHEALIERMNATTTALAEKLGAEEKVTVRQSAQQELLDKLAVNNRWLIGLTVTTALTVATFLAHVLNLF
jgi:hypothetical protein